MFVNVQCTVTKLNENNLESNNDEQNSKEELAKGKGKKRKKVKNRIEVRYFSFVVILGVILAHDVLEYVDFIVDFARIQEIKELQHHKDIKHHCEMPRWSELIKC